MKKQKAKKAPATKTRAVISRDDGKLGLRERLKAKLRPGAKGKPVKEIDSRDELDRDSGRWTRRVQLFDHQNDYTKETVTFEDTGEVKFSKEGKLSEKNKDRLRAQESRSGAAGPTKGDTA